MTLGDLALAAWVFGAMTNYRESLQRFRDDVGGRPDLSDKAHRLRLLKWLNEWGVRGLATDWHHKAAESIRVWHDDHAEHVAALDPPHCQDAWRPAAEEDLAKAFDALAGAFGAWRRVGRAKRKVTIGPTATSKVLFALRPDVFPPWDDKMRRDPPNGRRAYDGDGSSYVRFVRDYWSDIRDAHLPCGSSPEMAALSQQLDCDEDELPILLMNAYYMVVVSRKVGLPDAAQLGEWAAWMTP